MPWVATGHPLPDALISSAMLVLTPVVFAVSFIATYWLITTATAMVFDLISRLCGIAERIARTFKG